MNEILLQTLTEKSEQQDARLDQMAEKMAEAKQRIDAMEDFKTTVNSLRAELEATRKQTRAMGSFFDIVLSAVNKLLDGLSQPLTQQHHHHFPKILWVTIGLFLTLTMAIVLWVNTRHELASYRTADTKYRYLQLQQDKELIIWLYKADSLAIENPDSLRISVERQEANIDEKLKLLKEANRKENEAAELRDRAKK